MEITNRELIDITNALQAAAEKTYPVRVSDRKSTRLNSSHRT